MWVASQSGNFLGREDADFYRSASSQGVEPKVWASQLNRSLPGTLIPG